MCTIIDTNSISKVFNASDKDHAHFKPIHDWILLGKGKIIFGGTKYKLELGKMPQYVKIVNQLAKAGKAVIVNDADVDKRESDIEKTLRAKRIPKTDKRFNDAHLIGIVDVSKARIITSKDLSSVPFVTNKIYYKNKIKTPVYYSSKRNINLISHPQYICKCCR